MSQLRQMEGAFERAGVDVAVVTLFDRETTQHFRRELKIAFPCLPDPERKVYGAYGVGRIQKGAGGTWRALHKTIRLVLSGAPLRMPKEDVMQLGAEFLIGQGLEIRMAHYPAAADLHLMAPDIQKVLDDMPGPAASE